MNLLEVICKELGVEVGEEWLGNDGNNYMATKKGNLLRIVHLDNSEEDGFKYTDNISRILVGELKPVWKPKKGDIYYVPDIYHCINNEMWVFYEWGGSQLDKALQNRGLAFKTKAEAIEAANKMLAALKEDE